MKEPWQLDESSAAYAILRRGETWITTLPVPTGEEEPYAARWTATLALARELVEQANCGVAAAEEDAQMDDACSCAEEELKGRSPAWVAANLVREAVLILTMDRPEDMSQVLLGKSIARLGSAMKNLQLMLLAERWRDEKRQAALSASQAAADDEGNIG